MEWYYAFMISEVWKENNQTYGRYFIQYGPEGLKLNRHVKYLKDWAEILEGDKVSIVEIYKITSIDPGYETIALKKPIYLKGKRKRTTKVAGR